MSTVRQSSRGKDVVQPKSVYLVFLQLMVGDREQPRRRSPDPATARRDRTEVLVPNVSPGDRNGRLRVRDHVRVWRDCDALSDAVRVKRAARLEVRVASTVTPGHPPCASDTCD